jgi:hypothetical protein
MKLGISFFHPKRRDKEWESKVLYVSDIVHHYHGPTEVYVSETDPFQDTAFKYDMILTTKMKKKHQERTDYLGYFTVL